MKRSSEKVNGQTCNAPHEPAASRCRELGVWSLNQGLKRILLRDSRPSISKELQRLPVEPHVVFNRA
jgi:hypothetical protein